MTVLHSSTRSAATPSSAARARVVVLLVLAWLSSPAPAARAGGDDFEFGKKLAEARYFDYARKVFDGILTDREPHATRTKERGPLRPGPPAEGGGHRRHGAAADVTYEETRRRSSTAPRTTSQTFVEKNPKNTNAAQARLDVGTIRLAFVQWARELLDDPDETRRSGA